MVNKGGTAEASVPCERGLFLWEKVLVANGIGMAKFRGNQKYGVNYEFLIFNFELRQKCLRISLYYT